MLLMELPFHKMFFLLNLQLTNHFNVAKFHMQTSNKLKQIKHLGNVHCLKSFKPIYALVDAVFS